MHGNAASHLVTYRCDDHAEAVTDTAGGADDIRMGSARGRWILFTTVLGSGLALLDSTVVNIALERIGDEFDASFAALQWTINGYTLTLAGLILLGGSLGDRFGRRRIFVIGVVWFAVASALCGLAPSVEFLIAGRALQGVGGALLTPGSLALISASFHGSDRAAAIGAWSGLGGVAGAIGPFLGGWLVEWTLARGVPDQPPVRRGRSWSWRCGTCPSRATRRRATTSTCPARCSPSPGSGP